MSRLQNDEKAAQVLNATGAVMGSLDEFKLVIGRIQEAVTEIDRERLLAVQDVLKEHQRTVLDIHQARDSALAAIKAATPSRPRNADNPEFQTRKRTSLEPE